MLMQNISADRCGEEVGGLKMNARNILAKKREFMIVLSAIALIACPLYGCGSSTGAHAGITRLDDEGYLYYMDYTKDYYGKDVMDAMRKVGFIDSGCSTFFTHNTDGAPITCRNVDEAVQNPHTNASGISMTQYSAIYNNEKKTVEVWPFQNYLKSFVFDVTGNQVTAGK